MSDWSTRLCEALDEREEGLATACSLAPSLLGEAFEQGVGLLLEAPQNLWLVKSLSGLLGEKPGADLAGVTEGISRMEHRLDRVMEALNTTLYREFGLDRIDPRKAEAGYRALLTQLGDPELIVATTNYDRSAELAFRRLGREVTTGFSQGEGRPVLGTQGLGETSGKRTPVIHLHGCVGWYQGSHKRIFDHFGDTDYNASLGTPVVLYPDPRKDPANNPLVQDLWREFDRALDWADHVLVLGHSMSDAPLKDMIYSHITYVPVAITHVEDLGPGRREMSPSSPRMVGGSPDFYPIRCAFGPEPVIDREDLEFWLEAKDYEEAPEPHPREPWEFGSPRIS
jgi:hypothetical protein